MTAQSVPDPISLTLAFSLQFQVSFGGGGGGGGGSWGASANPPAYYNGAASAAVFEDPAGKPGMLEVVAGLSRDCFIIPLACVDRFLPAGLTVRVNRPFIAYNRNVPRSAGCSGMLKDINVLCPVPAREKGGTGSSCPPTTIMIYSIPVMHFYSTIFMVFFSLENITSLKKTIDQRILLFCFRKIEFLPKNNVTSRGFSISHCHGNNIRIGYHSERKSCFPFRRLNIPNFPPRVFL